MVINHNVLFIPQLQQILKENPVVWELSFVVNWKERKSQLKTVLGIALWICNILLVKTSLSPLLAIEND